MDESLMTLKENGLVEITEPNTLPIELSVEDEYDMDKLRGHIDSRKRMMIKTEYGGCGKSCACKSVESTGHKVLFVCPTNRLANNYKEHACTVNEFFGIGLTEGTNMAKFDDNGYDAIVFDEILFCSVRHLARIKRYCESNPDNIAIAAGDTNQLECIYRITNKHDYDAYYNKCVDMIFPARMFFNTTCGRRASGTMQRSRASNKTSLTRTCQTATLTTSTSRRPRGSGRATTSPRVRPPAK